MGIWHYTVGVRLRSILRDKLIKPATAGVPAGERPVVWFTTNPEWEPTANKGVVRYGKTVWLTRAETEAEGGGLFRIEVAPETAPYGWEEFKRLSGITEREEKRLARRAREWGSDYHDWRVSFEPVGADKWARIETRNRDRWEEVPRDGWDFLETAPEIVAKGCPLCGRKEQPKGIKWQPVRDPTTAEWRALCWSCFALVQERIGKREP